MTVPPGSLSALATRQARMVIVGAGGFGREVFDIVGAMNGAGAHLDLLGYVDDGTASADRLARLGTALLGTVADLATERERADWELVPDLVREVPAGFVIAIGRGDIRQRIESQLAAAQLTALTLVHPMATVGTDNRIGRGCILAAGARVTTNITLGRHTQLHVNATIGHDSTLGDFVSVYPGATVSGDVTLGDGVTIGTGANVLPGLSVGHGAMVGGGAVVTRDVDPGDVVAGVPAKPVRS
ncbi:MAG: acetyltransferase [Actinomycetota bacterium]